jgi:small-conductance mechanosensitive channel
VILAVRRSARTRGRVRIEPGATRTLEPIALRIRDVLTLGIPGTPLTIGRVGALAALLVLLLYLNRRFTRWIVDSVLARRNIDIGVRQAVGTLLRYTITAVGLVVILQTVGIELSALTVLAGAVGVGLGFGLQNIASNFVSGLIILFERPIKVGDRIEVGGVVGQVRHIGGRATTVVTDENIAVIVPNSQFVSDRVTNWSHTGELTAFLVRVKVAWDADADLVRRLLLEAAADHPNVLREPPPDVELRDLRGGLQFSLQVWSTDVQAEGRLKSDLNFAIREKLRRHDIAAPVRGDPTGGSR